VNDEICTWAAQNLMSFWIPAAVAAFGGVVGGIAEYASHIKMTNGALLYDEQPLQAADQRVLRLMSAVIGWAGAWATLFIFVATRWWETESETPSLSLFVLTLSVAAGFGARRLLPDLVDRLKVQIEQTKQQAEAATRKAGQAEQLAAQALKHSERMQIELGSLAEANKNIRHQD
jgi:hypothetical protein